MNSVLKSLALAFTLFSNNYADTMTLKSGWNLVSPILANELSITDFFSQAGTTCNENNITRIWGYNGGWSGWTPSDSNSSFSIKPKQGYWFLVKSGETCTISNAELNQDVKFNFDSTGWKLVGTNSQKSLAINASGLLNPINFTDSDPDVLKRIWGYDGNSGGWKGFSPTASNNKLESLEGGQGYWLLLNDSLDFDESNTSFADLLPPVCPGCPKIK